MLLARSFWRKAFVTLIAAGLFVRLYEVTIPDSKFSMLPLGFELAADAPARPSPGVKLTFAATAYCKGLITNAGVPAQAGILASDPTRPAARHGRRARLQRRQIRRHLHGARHRA